MIAWMGVFILWATGLLATAYGVAMTLTAFHLCADRWVWRAYLGGTLGGIYLMWLALQFLPHI